MNKKSLVFYATTAFGMVVNIFGNCYAQTVAVPDSPFDRILNEEFDNKPTLELDGWGEKYLPLSSGLNLSKDTLYLLPDNGIKPPDSFVSIEGIAEFALNDQTLRFDVEAEGMNSLMRLHQQNTTGVLKIIGSGNMEMRFSSDSERMIWLSTKQSKLQTDVENVWLEFIPAVGTEKPDALLYGAGGFSICANNNTVFLLNDENFPDKNLSIIHSVAGTGDRTVDGRNIYLGYVGTHETTADRIGILVESPGEMALHLGSKDTDFLTISNVSTAIKINNSSDHYPKSFILGKEIIFVGNQNALFGIDLSDGQDLYIGDLDTSISIIEFPKAIQVTGSAYAWLGSEHSTIKYVNLQGDLISKNDALIYVNTKSGVINGDVTVSNWGYAHISSLEALEWSGAAKIFRKDAEDASDLSVNLGSGSLWNVSDHSEVSSLSLIGATVDLTHADSEGIPQFIDNEPVSLKIGKFKGIDSTFVLGTDLMQQKSSLINIAGDLSEGDESSIKQSVGIRDINEILDTKNIQKTQFASVAPDVNVVFNGITLPSAHGLTLVTPIIESEEQADGTVNWYFVPEKDLPDPDDPIDPENPEDGNDQDIDPSPEPTPGYTPQAIRQTVDNNYFFWRAMAESTHERLGALRRGASVGVWGRVTGGRLSQDGFSNDFVSYRIGNDVSLDASTRIGFMLEHYDGDVDWKWGSGESNATMAALYGIWLSEYGSYVDAGIRFGKFKYDYTNTKDLIDSFDFQSSAYGFWSEVGHEFNITDKFFISPHASINVGRISSDSFDTKVGLHGKFDNSDSAIFSYGSDFGYKSEKVSIVFTVDGQTELLGDMDLTVAYGDAAIRDSWDHKDTWVELGGSLYLRPNDNLQGWINLKTSTCSEVDEDWRINAGLMYRF